MTLYSCFQWSQWGYLVIIHLILIESVRLFASYLVVIHLNDLIFMFSVELVRLFSCYSLDFNGVGEVICFLFSCYSLDLSYIYVFSLVCEVILLLFTLFQWSW